MIQSIKIFALMFLFCHASMSMHSRLPTALRLGKLLPAARSSFHKQRNYKYSSKPLIAAILVSTAVEYYLERIRNIQPLFNPTWDEFRAKVERNVIKTYPDQVKAIMKAFDQEIEIYRTNNLESTPWELLEDLEKERIELHATIEAQIRYAFEDENEDERL